VVSLYLGEEQSLRESIRFWRSAQADTSNEYIGSIMQSGWSAAEVNEVLEAENLFSSNPGILDNLNAIMAASGMPPLAGPDLVDVIHGRAPTRVYEAINDTLRLQAMKQAGLEVDPALAAEFGEGVAEQVASAAQRQQYSAAAQTAALDLIQNWREVDLGKLGIGRDEIVQAAFGEGFAAQTEAKLQKFLRERQTAGQGWGGYSAYQGGEGQIVLSGLKQL